MYKMKNVERTTEGLRNALFDELDAMRGGKSTPARANAICRLSVGVIEVVKTEIEYTKLVANTNDPAPLDQPLTLGNGG